ncbi:MAG: DinB family protein [Gemmatimonadetes bacterium]|jgi:uncharacterized damage-inducible protein DinB|nr:DinB family protein [Gemmatimonadota bacterium]
MRRVVFLLTLALPLPALAQSAPAANPAVAAIRSQWEAQAGYLLRSAEQMPEADYGYKPVATVRTFGQLIGHVAGAQNAMCATALGEPERSEDEIEKTATTKAQLVAALRASSESCRRAYAQTDATAAGEVTSNGEKQTRFAVLAMNAAHDAEHYGNVVTYLRIKGMVPPSSQPRP